MPGRNNPNIEQNQPQGPLISDEDILAEGVYEDMISRISERAKENESPVGKLQTAKKQYIEDFGKQPLSEDAVQKVMGLNNLNEAIRIAKKDPKKFTDRSAFDVITDLYSPATSKKRTYFSLDINDYEAEQTMKSLIGKNEGKTFTLDEMTKLVNDTHQAEKNAEKGPKGPQA